MVRIATYLSSILILYFIYGFYLSLYNYNVVNADLTKSTSLLWYEYKGTVNIHSEISIGSSSYSQIIQSAKNARLDYLIFTDLNSFQNQLPKTYYSGNTLVLFGEKISYQDSRIVNFAKQGGHLSDNLGGAQIKLADLLSQPSHENNDNLTYLAHPFLKNFNWNGDFPLGFDGFEVINPKSISNKSWQKSILSVLWSLITYPFNPELAFIRLYSEPDEEWRFFDKLSQNRRIVAYAGSEASARALPFADYLIKFPSYQKTFEMFSQHILLKSELTGNAESDTNKIFSALKNGNFFIGFDLLGDTKGFQAFVSDNDNKIHFMGSSIKNNKNLLLKVQLPSKPKHFFEIIIYKDGEAIKRTNEIHLSFPIEKSGVYRIQVRVSPFFPLPDAKKWVSWIYSNPFFIQD